MHLVAHRRHPTVGPKARPARRQKARYVRILRVKPPAQYTAGRALFSDWQLPTTVRNVGCEQVLGTRASPALFLLTGARPGCEKAIAHEEPDQPDTGSACVWLPRESSAATLTSADAGRATAAISSTEDRQEVLVPRAKAELGDRRLVERGLEKAKKSSSRCITPSAARLYARTPYRGNL